MLSEGMPLTIYPIFQVEDLFLFPSLLSWK